VSDNEAATASNAAGAGETGSSGLGLTDMFRDMAKAACLCTRVAPSLRMGGGACALRGHQMLCIEINTGAYRGVPRDVVLVVDIAVVDNGVVEGQLGPRGSASKPCFGKDKTAHAHGLIHRIDDLARTVAFFRHGADDKNNGSGYIVVVPPERRLLQRMRLLCCVTSGSNSCIWADKVASNVARVGTDVHSLASTLDGRAWLARDADKAHAVVPRLSTCTASCPTTQGSGRGVCGFCVLVVAAPSPMVWQC